MVMASLVSDAAGVAPRRQWHDPAARLVWWAFWAMALLPAAAALAGVVGWTWPAAALAFGQFGNAAMAFHPGAAPGYQALLLALAIAFVLLRLRQREWLPYWR